MKKWNILFFIFLLNIVYASEINTQFYFMIPGVKYFFMPIFNSTTSYTNTGNHTIDLLIYLRNIDSPIDMNLSNYATVTGDLIDADLNYHPINFTNTGSGGLYQMTYNYNKVGSYKLTITAQNDSYGWSRARTYIYIGTFALHTTLTTSKAAYNKHELGSATLNVTDDSGNPQSGGNAHMQIIKPDGSIWIDWVDMAEIASGSYYHTFTTPSKEGTYVVNANFSKDTNNISTSTTFIVKPDDTSTNTPGGGAPGGGDYYIGGDDYEIRYDIIPRSLNLASVVGSSLKKGFIIKNMGSGNLIVELITDLKLIKPATARFGIASNSEQEVKFDITGSVGVYSKNVYLKLYNPAGRESYENLSVKYTFIDAQKDGNYCLADTDCISKYCSDNICAEKPVKIIPNTVNWAKEVSSSYPIILVFMLLAICFIMIIAIRKSQMLSMIDLSGNIKKTTSAVIISIMVLIVVIPFFFLTKPVPEITQEQQQLYANITNISTQIKYSISPHGINKLFIVGESVSEVFTVTNLEKDYVIFTFSSNLSVTPKRIVIAGGKQQDVTVLLTGPNGTYDRKVDVEIMNLLGIIEHDSVSVKYQIVVGKALNQKCQSSSECYSKSCQNNVCSEINSIKLNQGIMEWNKEHPLYFFIMACVTIIGILFIILIYHKKDRTNKHLSAVMIALTVILIGMLLIILFNSSKDTLTSNLNNNSAIVGKTIGYEISPASISMNLTSEQSVNITVRNKENNILLVNIDTALNVFPKTLVIQPWGDGVTKLTLKGNPGTYQNEIIFNVNMLDLSEVGSLNVKYHILDTKQIVNKDALNWLNNNFQIITLFVVMMLLLIGVILVARPNKPDKPN
jgi:hypothetical protein